MGRLLAVNSYNYRRGGADVVCLDQEAWFAKQGWRVAKFAMKHPANEPSPWDEYFADEIEFASLKSVSDRLAGSLKVIYSNEAARKITRLMEDFQPDVIHAHNVYHHLSPSVLRAGRRFGIPVLMTLHDTKLLCPAHSMNREGRPCESCRPHAVHNVVRHRCLKGSAAVSALSFVESAVHRALRLYDSNVDRFIVPSRFLIEKFVEWGWDRERFELIPNAVPVETMPMCHTVGRQFVYFGRLGEGKGLHTLVRAVAAAGVRLRMIGSGPLEAELKELASTLGARIEWVGALYGERLRDAVSQARAIVLPAEAYENAPMSILEAYALGRPAIAASIGGIPEMIQPGRTGTLFEPGNVQMLVEVLNAYQGYTDARLAGMGEQCRRLVEEHYTLRVQYDRLVALYRSLGVQVHKTRRDAEGEPAAAGYAAHRKATFAAGADLREA